MGRDAFVEFGPEEIGPGSGRGPALFLKNLVVVPKTRTSGREQNSMLPWLSRHSIKVARVRDLGKIELVNQSKLYCLIERTVIKHRNINFRLCFLCPQLT